MNSAGDFNLKMHVDIVRYFYEEASKIVTVDPDEIVKLTSLMIQSYLATEYENDETISDI